jgi:hypothetical protein
MWNKEDYARQLLINRKDRRTMAAANYLEQNKSRVSKMSKSENEQEAL